MRLLKKPFTTMILPSVLLILVSSVACSQNVEAAERREFEDKNTTIKIDEQPNFSGQSHMSNISFNLAAKKLPSFSPQQALRLLEAMGLFGGEKEPPKINVQNGGCFNKSDNSGFDNWFNNGSINKICVPESGGGDAVAYGFKLDDKGNVIEMIPYFRPSSSIAPLEREVSPKTVTKKKSCR